MKETTKPLVDQAARDRAVEDISRSYCVEAGAGTGKTTLLVDRFLSIVRRGKARCSQVVSITFTEKAAGEMKVRLRGRITALLGTGDLDTGERERLETARRELERAPISTIHSFAASILREHPLEAGIDPRFVQLDALEGSLFLDECWNEFLSHASTPHESALKRFISFGGSVDKLRDMAFKLYDRRGERHVEGIFEKNKRAAVETARAKVYKSGFESARIKGKGLRSDSMGLRELKDAIQEGAGRLSSLADNHCSDPDDLGCREIRTFLEGIDVLKGLEGEELEDFLLTVALPKPKGNKRSWSPPGKCTEQKEVVRELIALRKKYRSSFSDRLRDALVGWLEEFVWFVDRRKAEEGVLDFDDLLIRTRELLRDFRSLRALRRRYLYILVDEFQDTDPLQAEIILLLAGGRSKGNEPQPGKLFIVGDPKQSIYRFRKADVEVYEEVKERLSASGSHLKITQNFRSVPGIVDWVNSTFASIIRKPERGRYQPEYEPIQPRRGSTEPAVVLLDLGLEGEDPKADTVRRREGEAIARFVRWLVREGRTVMDTDSRRMRPLRYGDVAVIYPGTTGIDYYEDPLRSEKIPYIVEGGKLYYARQEIRDLASSLWAVEDPWDSLSLVAALRSPLFGFSDEEIFLFVRAGGHLSYLNSNVPGDEGFSDFSEAFRLLADLHLNRNERGPAGTIIELLHRTNYMELSKLRPHGEQRVLNIRKAIQTARIFEGRFHSYRRFARWFRDQELLGTAEGESPLVEGDEDAVKLITIHKAKGLQFPVVIMANLIQKMLRPQNLLLERGRRLAFRLGAWMETSDFASLAEIEMLKEEAEAARLLYVATTRAGDLLVVPGSPKEGSYFDLLSDHLPLGEGDEPDPLAGGREPDHPPRVADKKSDRSEPAGDSGYDPGKASLNVGRVLKWKASELPPLRGVGRPFIKLPGLKERDEGTARKREWLAARRDLLDKGSEAQIVITPSGMERLHDLSVTLESAEPLSALALETLEPGAAGAAVGRGLTGVSGTDEVAYQKASVIFKGDDLSLRFGSAFHRLMEIVDLSGSTDPGGLAASIAVDYGLGDEAGWLESLAKKALSSDILKSASRASRILREVPFTVPIEPPSRDSRTCHFLEGWIDLLFEVGGCWTAVDYKTDEVSGEALEERFGVYRVQGALYAAALHRLGINLEGGMHFYFVRPDEVRSLEVSGELIGFAEDRITSAVLSGKGR